MTEQPLPAPSRVIVYSYGVHYKWAKKMPEVVMQQLRAGHSLREDLVSLQHHHEDQVKAIWSSYPAVAATEAALAEAEAEAEAAAEKVKTERVKQQTKRIKGPAADELKQARGAAKQARIDRRSAIAAVRDEAKARLDAVMDVRRQAEKDLYRTYCSEGPLYHGTFADVVDAHRAAAQRMAKKRRDGQSAALRHHRFTAEGRMLVKLQRSAGDPARTPEVIADGESGRYRNVLHIPEWVHPDEWDTLSRAEQRRRGRVTARMRLGGAGAEGSGEIVDIPIQIDRMPPPDADIVSGKLVVRQVGSTTKVTLNVTAKLPPAIPVSDGPAIAVHLGWRREDRGVRVATWRATSRLNVPEALTGVMTSTRDGLNGTVLLPDRLVDRRARLEKEQAHRDDSLNAVKAHLIDWLAAHGPVDHPAFTDRETGEPEAITAAVVARWRAAGRFAVLAHHWRNNPPTGADGHDGGDIADALEQWRRVDKAAWDREAHGSRKVTSNRNDLYGQIAAVLGYQTATIVIGDESLADLARQISANEDLPNEVATKIGHQRALAAPGVLRDRILTTAAREGVEVVTVSAKDLSRVHATCGTINDNSVPTGNTIRCDCGHSYDVDANAVALMLDRAGAAPIQREASATTA